MMRQKLSYFALVMSLCFPATLWAGEQADLAVRSVKQLVKSGEIERGAVLRLVVKQGNIANFLGQDYLLKNEWEQLTGTFIDAGIMPQKPSLAFIRETRDVDLTIARNREYPDLFEQQLITDLSPMLDRFGFSLDGGSHDGYLFLPLQSSYDGRTVAIPADGDLAVLYLRKDLLENPSARERFQKLYGVPLEIPKTWSEYQRLVEFFHQPDDSFFGSLEQRDPGSGWMFWMPRYAARQLPNQLLFDDQMRPLINSAEGIAATESYVATVPYSPPKILDNDSNYTYTLPLFVAGKGFSTISTLAGAKIFSLNNSSIKDRFLAVPMPGITFNDSESGNAPLIHRRSTLIYGNNIVIPQQSSNPLLAFLFAMWITDPDISIRSVTVKGGFADPYRYHHFSHERVEKTYTSQVLSTIFEQINAVVPAGTGLPGDAEYIDALNHNIHKAARGLLSAAQAMEQTAREWDEITDRYGRQSQIDHWRQVRQLYPGYSDK